LSLQSPPGEVETAVKDAIDAGYRHLDCAFFYLNENEVGNAISTKLEQGVVKREDLYVVSKLWNTYHEPQHVRPMLERSLNYLKLKYLDLYLVHWPQHYQYDLSNGDNFVPKNEKGEMIFANVEFEATWRAMEKLVDDGLVRSIGVSNFNSK